MMMMLHPFFCHDEHSDDNIVLFFFTGVSRRDQGTSIYLKHVPPRTKITFLEATRRAGSRRATGSCPDEGVFTTRSQTTRRGVGPTASSRHQKGNLCARRFMFWLVIIKEGVSPCTWMSHCLPASDAPLPYRQGDITRRRRQQHGSSSSVFSSQHGPIGVAPLCSSSMIHVDGGEKCAIMSQRKQRYHGRETKLLGIFATESKDTW